MAFFKFYGYIQIFSKFKGFVVCFIHLFIQQDLFVTFVGIGNKVTVLMGFFF